MMSRILQSKRLGSIRHREQISKILGKTQISRLQKVDVNQVQN